MSVATRGRTREKLWLDAPFTKAMAPSDGDGSGDLILSGWASTWSVDRDGEMVAPDAFKGSLDAYLKGNPILLWQHDLKCPIGQVTDAKTDATGLFVTATIPNPGPNAADWQKGAYNAIRLGIVKTFSIGGYFTRDVEMGPDGPVFTIVDAELFEISTVSIPANAGSLFEAMMKSWHHETPKMTAKATSQLHQLLGVEPVTDAELVLLSEDGRTERYKLLSDLFAKAHGGAKPPALGTLERIRSAKDAGADPRMAALAKIAFVRQLTSPQLEEVEEKAGRTISTANRTKLEAVLDNHKAIEDHLIDAAESMKAAAGVHHESISTLRDVLGITDEGTADGTQDEDEQEDQTPTSPSKSAEGEGEKALPTCPKCGTKITNPDKGCPNDDCDYTVPKKGTEPEAKTVAMRLADAKTLYSTLCRQLTSQAREALPQLLGGTDDDDDDQQSAVTGFNVSSDDDDYDECYVYLDDIDIDRNLAYFDAYGPETDITFSVPFSRGEDGLVTLGDTATEVTPQLSYVPKHLQWNLENKGVLSAPRGSFAPRDTSWSASSARSKLKEWSGSGDTPNAKYKSAFLWVDGEGNDFGDLKYPVASVFDGELKCVLAGVSAAAQRANQQGLGDLKAPLTTLYNRAAKQFDDASIKAPWSDD